MSEKDEASEREARMDAAKARKALEEFLKLGGKPISQIKKELGL